MMYIGDMDLVYYETSSGRRPVEEAINSLDRASRAKVLAHMGLLCDQGGQLREPHVKSFQKTLATEMKDKGFREAYEHHRNSYMIGESVRKLRRNAGMTQKDLAQAMGVPQQSISRLERGDADNPTLETLERIALATGRKLVVDFVVA